MASGKTLEMIMTASMAKYRTLTATPRETRKRDRTLAGKKRIRARRAARSYICGNPECPKAGHCGGECVRNF